jgi:molybdopterin/thiamine biosynthesis adenylyltransferase
MIYFNRQINLLGEQNQKNLKNKSIAIIGCGGLGCTIATALSGSGIGTIYLIDFDKIEIHNIHRQIAFKLDDIDKYKCEALANSCKQRVEYSQFIPLVKTFDEFINEGLCVDLIIDATDNLETRKIKKNKRVKSRLLGKDKEKSTSMDNRTYYATKYFKELERNI